MKKEDPQRDVSDAEFKTNVKHRRDLLQTHEISKFMKS